MKFPNAHLVLELFAGQRWVQRTVQTENREQCERLRGSSQATTGREQEADGGGGKELKEWSRGGGGNMWNG